MFALHTHRRQARMAGASDQGFFVHSSGAHASTRRYRARVLAEWLVDTWGVSALSQGSGVLDVAGGRGALSFELQVRYIHTHTHTRQDMFQCLCVCVSVCVRVCGFVSVCKIRADFVLCNIHLLKACVKLSICLCVQSAMTLCTHPCTVPCCLCAPLLQVVHGVPVTLIEPRPFKLDKYQHKVLKVRFEALAAHAHTHTYTHTHTHTQ